MPSALETETPLVEPPPFPIARFSVEKYHQMIESGIFTEDDRYELLDGWLVEQMTKGPGHEFGSGELEDLLRPLLLAGWHLRNQAPITLANSEPEPDLSVVRGTRADYRDQHPQARDVALVVEVADATLRTDRLKARIYAAAAIPEYWIVNLAERCVEVHRTPDPAVKTFLQLTVLGEDEFADFTVDGTVCGVVRVGDCLP
ncbi:MAG: Uma2 family endonuclease [Planctomycetaceae bacterium]